MKHMKIFSAIILFFLFSACSTHVKTGDGSHEINKKGSEVTEKRKITGFNHLIVDGVFTVYLKQGEKEELIIEADKAVAEHILTEIKNETLVISMENNTDFGDIDPVKIYLQVRDLKSLDNKGVGSIKCEKALYLHNFLFTTEGVGAIDLNVSADSFIVKSETVGAINLSGKVTYADITHQGVGVLHAFELLAQKLKLNSSGVGAAQVYASETIDIEASGVGSVTYKGNPKEKNIKSEGIGKVASAD